MPLLKGASSEYTTFLKYNALTLAAPAVKSSSAVAIPKLSIVGSFIRATRTGTKASPRTSVLKNYEVRAAAAEEGAATGPFYLPVSVGFDAFIVKYSLSGVVQWETTILGTGTDGGNGIAADSTGVYAIGSYTSTSEITLAPGVTLPITATASASAAPGQDAYIVKYNANGVAQWATTIRGTGIDAGYGIATDSTSVYVTGDYTSTSEITLNNNITLPISSTAPGRDAFIVKYNKDGLAQWATTVPGNGNDGGNGIAIDSTDVYVVGVYQSTSSVTLSGGIVTLPMSAGGSDIFIAKYNTSGVAQWATTIRGTSFDSGRGIAVDSTGVYVTGSYSSAVTLSGGIVALPTPLGGSDPFIVKYDKDGIAQWATTIRGNTGTDIGRSMNVDSTGIYVCGDYTSTSEITLNNNITLPITAGTTPGQDVFIVKYNTSGVAQWATTIRGTDVDSAWSMSVDSTGIYVTGRCKLSSEITLNNGKTIPASLARAFDVLIVKYNKDGLAQWVSTISGTTDDSGFGIAADSTGIYVNGQYTSTTPILLTNGS